MKRPSYKEIDQKLRQAREALARNQISIVNPVSFAADALELDFVSEVVADIPANIFVK